MFWTILVEINHVCHQSNGGLSTSSTRSFASEVYSFQFWKQPFLTSQRTIFLLGQSLSQKACRLRKQSQKIVGCYSSVPVQLLFYVVTSNTQMLLSSFRHCNCFANHYVNYKFDVTLDLVSGHTTFLIKKLFAHMF